MRSIHHPVEAVMTDNPEQRLRVEHFEFGTSDPATAECVTKEMYGECRQSPGSAEGFTFSFRRTNAGGMSLDHLVHTMDTRADFTVHGKLMFVFVTGGIFSIASDGQETRLRIGDTALYPAEVPIRLGWDRLRAEILCVPEEAVDRAVAEHDGDSEVRFLGTRPVSPEMDRFWRSTVGFVSHQLETPDSPLCSPLVRAQTLSLLGAAAVRAFPNTTMTADYRPGPGQASSAAVRQAVDFIDAHADQPITPDDIAAAAATTLEALEAAFTRHHGTSPLGYLRRVRLERAHRDLQSTDPTTGATVPHIATRWGFPQSGAFAARYHDVYGRPPGHTLHT
ncbi:AraC family transcriptional regulator [Streptomyces ovatisporus]|uniref:AraC family transcriptional regulator n=1 Tax=Streptomyces ovatisporus TaxID=1128682 RepID=A0ABV9A941_9ACTN